MSRKDRDKRKRKQRNKARDPLKTTASPAEISAWEERHRRRVVLTARGGVGLSIATGETATPFNDDFDPDTLQEHIEIIKSRESSTLH